MFDRLLDSAPQYDMARLDGLSNRIAAAVEHQPRIVSRNASAPSAKFKSGWLPLRRYNGVAATALAASLMLGVFAGQLNMFNSAADVLLSGGDLGTQVSAKQMAQTDDAEGLMDEDLLWTVEVNPSIPGQRPRYLYFGFIASLAVNLLFIGLLTAAWHLHQEEHDRPPASGLLGFLTSYRLIGKNRFARRSLPPVRR